MPGPAPEEASDVAYEETTVQAQPSNGTLPDPTSGPRETGMAQASSSSGSFNTSWGFVHCHVFRKQSKIVNCAARPLFARADGDAGACPEEPSDVAHEETAVQAQPSNGTLPDPTSAKGNWNGTGLLLQRIFQHRFGFVHCHLLRKQSKIVNCAARPLFARADGDAGACPEEPSDVAHEETTVQAQPSNGTLPDPTSGPRETVMAQASSSSGSLIPAWTVYQYFFCTPAWTCSS